MKIRLLDETEHGKTRALWEEVFSEDTKAFLDYYYFIKTKENKIYVIEEEGGIRSMLHLNPYRMRIEDRVYDSNYIVAVATQSSYRKRGYMGALLTQCIEEMYAQRMPFTFLMPAAEAIYTPYDFRYIYSQPVRTIRKSDCATEAERGGVSAEDAPVLRDAGLWDADDMAQFFDRHFSNHYQVHAIHDTVYYRTMIMEQQSERGGVALLRRGEQITGMFAYAMEEGFEIREMLCLPQERSRLYSAIGDMWRTPEEQIRIVGCLPEEADGHRPIIMARIVYLKAFLTALKSVEEEALDCSFAVIDPIAKGNSRVWRLRSASGKTRIEVTECEDSEGIIPIADLTEFLFGCCTADDLEKRENVILSGHLKQEIQKINPLKRVFLNEIV